MTDHQGEGGRDRPPRTPRRGRSPGPPPPGWSESDWQTASEGWARRSRPDLRAVRDEFRRRRMEEAAREDLIGRPRWMRHRGFGCVFGLLFLFVIGSLVAGMAIVVSRLGPIPGIVALLAVVAVLVGMGRTLFLTARTLDRLVEATRRVEAGDYTVRVDVRPRSTGGLQVVGQLTDGFDTMITRLEADEAPAPHPPGRHQPRAADAPERRPGQPGGDRRRRLSARSGASRRRPRRDARPGPADRRPPDARAVRGGHAGPPPGADRSRCPGRRRRALVRAGRRGRGRRAHGGGRRRSPDPRDRPGPDPRGAGESRRQCAAPHAGRWAGDGVGRGRG